MSSLELVLNHNDEYATGPDTGPFYQNDSQQPSSQSECEFSSNGLWLDHDFPGYQLDATLVTPDNGFSSQSTDAISFSFDPGQDGWADLAESGYPLPSTTSFQDEQTDPPTLSDTLMTDDTDIVCLGMIYRAPVKLMGDMSTIQNRLNEYSQPQRAISYIFSLRTSEEQTFLTFEDGTEVGTLNVHISKAIASLMATSKTQFDAVANVQSLYEMINRAKKAGDAVLRVDINVYGLSKESKGVGRLLSKTKVYLQRPDQQRPNSVYANPQVLDLGDSLALDEDIAFDDSSRDDKQSKNIDSFDKTVSDVYASLKRSDRLKILEGRGQLKTDLLPHQKKALDFLVQREVGPVPSEFALWRPVEIDGQKLYRHAITQAKSSSPSPEIGGGVLADEMGMGKSLSILTLITHRLRDAHTWELETSADSVVAESGERVNSRATLIVVSSALLINNWLNEIDIHVKGSLKVMRYHGQHRKIQLANMKDYDIVITTYHTLASDFMAKKSPLHRIAWFRIVLDEAHIIRRQATKLNRTVSELSGRSRWCLTGTPIQNRLEDIGALFAFIRARPFDSMAMFRRFIAVPFDESDERRLLASQRLSLLIDSLCIRRTRDMLDLPEGRKRVRYIDFSKEERVQYEQTKQKMIRTITQRAGEYDGNSKFGMFQAQLQLRILCNHGTFQHHFSWARSRRDFLDENEDALCSLGRNGETNCSSCGQCMPIISQTKAPQRNGYGCAHSICSECLDQDISGSKQDPSTLTKCPLCTFGDRLAASEAEHIASDEANQRDDYFRSYGHSSKMVALVADIQEGLWSNKSIIFSCWTRTLNLVSKYLRGIGIPFNRIDGETPLAERQNILDDFAENPKTPVLIMTTGTGAYGLNLTSANRVFIVEPQWNPSVENQAISRAMRLGQDQSVLVTRYVVKGTVEQEMRSQQDRKRRIAQIGWDERQESRGMVDVE